MVGEIDCELQKGHHVYHSRETHLLLFLLRIKVYEGARQWVEMLSGWL